MMIRVMTMDDLRPMRRLMMAYLKDTYEAGGEYSPTLENAAVFLQYAVDGAACGDPCLVATDDNQIVGYIIARGMDIPGTIARNKTLRSWGTYVTPSHRTKGVAVSLFIVAGRMARVAGYTRFLGMTYGTEYENHALGVVNRIPGMQEVGKVLVMDLTRKAVHAEKPKDQSSLPPSAQFAPTDALIED